MRDSEASRRNLVVSFLGSFTRTYASRTHTRRACVRACTRARERASERNAESRGLHSDANSPLPAARSFLSFSYSLLSFSSPLRHRAEALRARPARPWMETVRPVASHRGLAPRRVRWNICPSDAAKRPSVT